MPRLPKGTFRNRPQALKREASLMKATQALQLRLAGATYDQIAEQLDYLHKGRAHDAVQKALIATVQEPADAYRKMELARLDRLLLSIWTQATTSGPGQLAAIDRALRIMAQRLYYVAGLKVPETVAEVRPDGTSVYDPQAASLEFQQLMQSLTARYQQDAPEEVADDARSPG